LAQGFVFTAKTMYLVLSNSSPYGREVYMIIKISGDRTLKDLSGGGAGFGEDQAGSLNLMKGQKFSLHYGLNIVSA